jgi:Beta propeller domain
VHTLVASPALDATLHYSPAGFSACARESWSDDDIRSAYQALPLQNVDIIRNALSAQAVPVLHESGRTLEEKPCDPIHHASGGGRGYTTLASIDMSADDPVSSQTTIISRPGVVYASQDALYLAVRRTANAREPCFLSSQKTCATPAMCTCFRSAATPAIRTTSPVAS